MAATLALLEDVSSALWRFPVDEGTEGQTRRGRSPKGG